MTAKITGLLLGSGFAETQGLTLMPVYHEDGFELAQEAVHHFAKSLKNTKAMLYPPISKCKACGSRSGLHRSLKEFFYELAYSNIEKSNEAADYLFEDGWSLEGTLYAGNFVVVNYFDGYLDFIEGERRNDPCLGEVLYHRIKID